MMADLRRLGHCNLGSHPNPVAGRSVFWTTFVKDLAMTPEYVESRTRPGKQSRSHVYLECFQSLWKQSGGMQGRLSGIASLL